MTVLHVSSCSAYRFGETCESPRRGPPEPDRGCLAITCRRRARVRGGDVRQEVGAKAVMIMSPPACKP